MASARFASQRQRPSCYRRKERTRIWCQHGLYHREDDRPTSKAKDSQREWHIKGRLHRDGGPAFVDKWGNEMWHSKGDQHRLDGPAVTYADGGQEYWQQGKVHRDPKKGPAVIQANGETAYCINGKPWFPEEK